jgi:1,4-dihydroxy-2-naphthoyl-CoA hydrolase
MLDEDHFNQLGVGFLPGHLGMGITYVGDREVHSVRKVTQTLMAPNGYLHAGTAVALADTTAGSGCVTILPADPA